MKIKRILCGIIATMMLFCSTCMVAFAATSEEVIISNDTDEPVESFVIPLNVTGDIVEPASTNANRIALGSASSGLFWNSGSVTVTILPAITYKVNEMRIAVVNRTNGSIGHNFTIECTNKAFHNRVTCPSGPDWHYYQLKGINASGGDSVTIQAQANPLDHNNQYELLVGLYYNPNY